MKQPNAAIEAVEVAHAANRAVAVALLGVHDAGRAPSALDGVRASVTREYERVAAR